MLLFLLWFQLYIIFLLKLLCKLFLFYIRFLVSKITVISLWIKTFFGLKTCRERDGTPPDFYQLMLTKTSIQMTFTSKTRWNLLSEGCWVMMEDLNLHSDMFTQIKCVCIDFFSSTFTKNTSSNICWDFFISLLECILCRCVALKH